MKREELLDKVMEEQLKVIENLKKSVDRYKKASDIDEDDTIDSDDFARQTEAKDMQLRFEKILNQEEQYLKFIKSERETLYIEVEKGAIVETDKAYFFVGVSLSPFQFNGKDVFCISTEAPIFQSLKNKKNGDKVKLGINEHKIIEIY